jgi:hypothetical protein
LYLALVRFVTSDLQFAHHMRPDRTANPFDWRDRRFTGHTGSIASGGHADKQAQRQGFRGTQ